MSSSRATPISAVMNGPVTQLVVTFDEDLVFSPTITPSNYLIRYANQIQTVTTGNVNGAVLTLNLTPGAADVGIDKIDYDPPPYELVTALSDLDVAAWTDYPVT